MIHLPAIRFDEESLLNDLLYGSGELIIKGIEKCFSVSNLALTCAAPTATKAC